MLVTVRAFALFFFHLILVASITNLVLAITRIEFLLILLEVILAHIADIWPSDNLFLRGGIIEVFLLVSLFLFLL